MSDAVNDFLMGGGGAPSAKFPTIGTVVRGLVTKTEVSQQTDPDTNEPKTWPDGNPMMQAIITVQTDDRDPAIDDDDGLRRIFVKGQMQKAIKDAVTAAGVGRLEVGGQLAVRYTGDGEKKKAHHSAPKLYAAQYRAPNPAGDMLAAEQTASAAPTAQTPAPAQQQAQQVPATAGAPANDDLFD